MSYFERSPEDSAEFDYRPERHLRDSFSESLSSAIQAAATTSSFVASAQLSQFVLPGLFVTGVGDVALPVSTVDANKLIECSKQTIETTAGQPWTLDPANISFRNSNWNAWLQTLVKRVTVELGVPSTAGDIHAEFNEMVIYGHGSSYNEIQHNVDESDIFGSLAVYLPSVHSEAKERLRYGEHDEYLFQSDISALCDVTYLAWYRGVSREVESIHSGHRVVLMYNLVCPTWTGIPSAATKQHLQEQLNSKLDEWECTRPCTDLLCYAFDQTYALENLRLSTLRGADYYRACHMLTASQRSGKFFLLLAQLEKVVIGDAEEDYEDEVGGKYTLELRPVVDLNGGKLSERQSIFDTDLIQELYRGRKEDKRTGYEGEERVFVNTVMVIVRRDAIVNVILGDVFNEGHYRLLLQHCLTSLHSKQAGIRYREIISKLCSETCAHPEAWSQEQHETRNAIFGAAFVAACYIGEHDIATKILDATTGTFGYQVFAELAQLRNGNIAAVPDHLINGAFHRIKQFDQFQTCLHVFCRNLRLRSSEYHKCDPGSPEWREARLDEFLQQQLQFGIDEAYIFLDMVKYSNKTMYNNCIQPFVTRHLDDPTFVNMMIIVIFRRPPIDEGCRANVLRLLPQLIQVAMSHFDLRYYESPPCLIENRRQAKVLRDLHRVLLQHNKAAASELLATIKKECISYLSPILKWHFIIPLLEQMEHILADDSFEGHSFYHEMLDILLRDGKCEAEEVTNRVLMCLKYTAFEVLQSCNSVTDYKAEPCGDCRELAIFLINPRQTAHTFSNNVHNIDHMAEHELDDCEQKLEWPYLYVTKQPYIREMTPDPIELRERSFQEAINAL